MDLLTTAVTVLADPPKNSGPDFGKASPIGLLIVVILLICVFVLVWSMNRHLKKLPESFDKEPVTTVADDAIGAAKDDGAGSEGDAERPSHEPGG
ncbi:hypothetical protein ORI20_31320 [Mycobacterium sp. CVI_P3]|uniref:Secreted protein n=2 Tax=Mycobacterium pinniadriaticum TaxID=2994102 RepID=A0ABT3SQU0_9MYCO|nr:hypothetical protein [Mycobacterium pinniadriaticum]MCX2934758.1 hypothetical protein [Mycobacterium pinniadriaticum]MCX2941197.1 hypothetical protein [Mycobacterium pinniadriaticum]